MAGLLDDVEGFFGYGQGGPPPQPTAPPAPDPEVLANRQKLIDRMTAARQTGASWDQIHQSVNSRVDAARKMGATEQQIQHSLGFSSPDEMAAFMQGKAEQHLAATKPTSWTDALVSGWTHSSLAALVGVTPKGPEAQSSHGKQLAAGLVESAADFPVAIVGGVLGAAAGGAAGGGAGAVAGAAVPVAGETGASEVGGAVVAGGLGVFVGAGAGAAGLPQLIKSERDHYAQAMTNGQIKSPEDYVRMQGQVLKETGEAMGVGAVTAGVGGKVSPLLEKMGAGRATKFVGTLGAEATAMATAQAAIAGRLPRIEDVVDAAVTVGAFHVAAHVTPAGYHALRTRIVQEHVETGALPEDIASHAVQDPVYRAKMLGVPDPHVPPGSSRTATIALPYIPPPSEGSAPEASPNFEQPTVSPSGKYTHEVTADSAKNAAVYSEYRATPSSEPVKLGLLIDHATGKTTVNVDTAKIDNAANVANSHGPRAVRDMLTEVLVAHPEISEITGVRKTGAGGKSEITQSLSRAQVARIRANAATGREPGAPADQYIIPRAAGDFEHAAAWIFKEEGGLTKDTGGVTKYGISANAHPGVDIAHLSQGDAAEIYHREYWRAIDADALPPNMRLAAFDSAVNQGVGQTKTWLQDAHGDLQAFMRMRVAKYAQLARDPKYAKYAPAWAKRLKDLGASDAMAGVVQRGPDNVGREFSPEEREALDMDGEGGGKEPPGTPPPGGGATPEDEDPWKHVMGRVAEDEDEDRWGKTITGFKRIYGELFDPDHPIRALVDSVTKGDPLDDHNNPELLRRVAENSGEAVKSAISRGMIDLDGNTTGHSLEAVVEGKSTGQRFSVADQKRFLNGFAVAKWAVMMDAQGKKTGVDIDKAKAVIADGQGQFGEAFQHLVDWRNGTLQWLVDGGVHNSAKAAKLIADNESTIPGYRRMDDGSWKPVSTGKPGIWNPIKTAKGSERQVEPILKSLMQDAFIRHELASNNRAMVALTDLGIEGNKAYEKRAVDINVMSSIDELKTRGIDEDILSGLAKSAGRTLPGDQVPIFRDGKLYGVKFEDPELTRVLRGYDQAARGTIMKVLGTITSVPRSLQTRYNPLFPVRLLTYDLPWQEIVNPDSKGPLSSFLVGLGHMAGDFEGYQKWAQSGGADRVFDGMSKDTYIKRVLQGHEEQSLGANMWNVVKSPFAALTAWTRMVSTPMRFGRYIRGQQQGETPLRAAVASSEAAFHRPGYGGPVGKAWNTIVPYTTAHLNGMEKSVRALFGIGRTVTGVNYSAPRTWAKAVAFITAPAIANWFANKDQDWYKAMPDWQKDNAWFIVPPIDGSPPIPVAAPPILSAIFVGLPRRLLEAFVEDNPHAADNIWGSLGASLMPPGGLTGASILTPVVEHVANHSFHRDTPLVSQDTQLGVQPAEQFTPYSSSAARDLAQFASDLPLVHSGIQASPAVIDNYINQWSGPLGRAAAAAADAAIARPPDTPRPETPVSEWPGISSWVVRYPSAGAAPIQQFYDTTTKLNQEHGSLVKEIREGNLEAFKRIVDRGGPSAAAYHQINLGQNAPPGVDLQPYLDYLAQASQGADYANMNLVRQASQALTNAHKYSMSVYEDRNKSPHDKRQTLDMVNATVQQIAERGNEAMDRALIGVKSAGRSARAPVPDSIQFTPPAATQ